MKAFTHARRLGRVVSSPRHVWLLARMLGWSLSLPLLKRALPLRRLVRLMQLEPRSDTRDERDEERIAALSELAFRSRPRRSRDNCLDRALVTFRYLGRAGATPTMVVGIARDSMNAIAGHVWVTVDGEPVHDSRENLAEFAVVTAFGPDGRVFSTEAAIQIGEPPEGQTRRSTPPPAAPPR